MMNNYTSIEQSKKLLELGLGLETADMYYITESLLGGKYIDSPIVGKDKESDEYPEEFSKSVPCWSLGALRNLIPVGIVHNDTTVLFKNHNRIDGSWVYYFVNEDGIITVQFTGSDLNAAYETVVWLLENDYIKKEND